MDIPPSFTRLLEAKDCKLKDDEVRAIVRRFRDAEVNAIASRSVWSFTSS